MTNKAKAAVKRVFRRHSVPDEYARRPWCHAPPISAYSAAYRVDADTPAAVLAPEVEAMWDAYCREHRPTNRELSQP